MYCSDFYTNYAFKEKYILYLCVIQRVSFCVLLRTNISIQDKPQFLYKPLFKKSMHFQTNISYTFTFMHLADAYSAFRLYIFCQYM